MVRVGLGWSWHASWLKHGLRLAICARDAAELERARADLTGRGSDVVAIECDVKNKAQVEQMVQTIGERLGSTEVLLNNVGIITIGPMELMMLQDYEQAMQTHFWASLYTTLAILPEMRQRRSGRIVNISSIGGKVSAPHLLPYSASKFALTGFSQGLRAELAASGILVTTVCPGLMRTGSPYNVLFKGQHHAESA